MGFKQIREMISGLAFLVFSGKISRGASVEGDGGGGLVKQTFSGTSFPLIIGGGG